VQSYGGTLPAGFDRAIRSGLAGISARLDANSTARMLVYAMKTAILHLSDIHLRESDCVPTEWIRSAVSAASQITRHCTRTQLALTGDVAFSGKPEEFLVVGRFLKEVVAIHLEMTGQVLQVLLVPGNHDCDFSGNMDLDNRLRDSLLAASDNVDVATLAALLAKQRSYDAFAKDFSSHEPHGPLLSVVRNGDSEMVTCLLNSAVTSRRNEKAGELIIPQSELGSIAKAVHGAPIVVLLMHHPESWFDQASRDALRHVLDRHVSIVLTGHEHAVAARSDGPVGQDLTLRLSSMAVRDGDGRMMTEFRIVEVCEVSRLATVHVVDTASLTARVQSSLHLKVPASVGWGPQRLNATFRHYLGGTEIPILSGGSGHATLDDIFVYPDLRKLDADTQASSLADTVIREVLDKLKVVVCGAPKSGKTTLARRIMLDALSAGLAAIVIDGPKIECKNHASMKKMVHDHVERHYDLADVARFVATAPKGRCVVVDDFHRMMLPPRYKVVLLNYLAAEFDHVVLVTASRHILDEALAGDSDHREVAALIGAWPRYEIMRFGYEKRAELVERWVALAGRGSHPSGSRDKVMMEKHLSFVLGRNIVPAYPMWIIMVLSQLDVAINPSATGTSSATLYEAMVKLSLGRVLPLPGDIDVYFGYCTHLAGLLTERDGYELSEARALAWHVEYVNRMLIDLDFDRAMKALGEAKIVERAGGGVRFCFPYLRYYFVARHACELIARDDLERMVDRLVAEVHKEESSNLLVFMAYFLRGGMIVEKLAKRAEGLFADASEMDLGVAVKGIDDLPRIPPQLEVPPGGEERRRRERLRRIDAEERSRADAETIADLEAENDVSVGDIYELTRNLNASYRIVQIVGQVLRAFPGQLDGAAKARLASVAVDLALRNGEALLRQVAGAKAEFVSAFVDQARRLHPAAHAVDVKAAGEATLFELVRMGLFGIIRHTSHCLGVESLRKVHDLVLGRQGPSVSYGVLRLAMKLDYYEEFPRYDIVALSETIGRCDVALARDLLVGLVWQHLYVNHVAFDAKQAVCSKLGIGIGHRMILTDEK